MKPIYLDYAATTPLAPQVAHCMAECLTHAGGFGNAASQHYYGQFAHAKVETAREQIASLIQAHPEEIIFTSGATEANNLALKGAAAMLQRKGRHLITMKTEHKSVLDPCQQLEKEGYQVTYLTPDPNGLIDLAELYAAIRESTVLVSIMHVNNETGVVQDLDKIAAITAALGIALHVDAAQSAGKLPINVNNCPINMMSLCAHKIYGPKGVGALFIRKKPRLRVMPLIQGGGHEQGMRSGTLATHQIVGMGAAFALATDMMSTEYQHVSALRKLFYAELQSFLPVTANSDFNTTLPHILNLRFDNMIAKAILEKIPEIAASLAAACQGKGIEGSYVLRAMGLSQSQVQSSARFSFGRMTTAAEITHAVNFFRRLVS